jgi:DNA-binding transcriptional ArsR family regulator
MFPCNSIRKIPSLFARLAYGPIKTESAGVQDPALSVLQRRRRERNCITAVGTLPDAIPTSRKRKANGFHEPFLMLPAPDCIYLHLQTGTADSNLTALDFSINYVTIWLHIIMTTPTPYKAIADGTRREILDLLRLDPLTAGVIAERFRKKRLSRPAVSKHLRILRQSRLVRVSKRGRERVYMLNADPLREVDAWVQQYKAFWDRQLQAFREYVEADSKKERKNEEKR